jgi:hypothetical protein
MALATVIFGSIIPGRSSREIPESFHFWGNCIFQLFDKSASSDGKFLERKE